ncbi:restriction endonuclease subunit S [Cypionkella sp. TWP1-2-1b2]|uniref:restriction endonuclease subunit S n=1 Tax=Cypionkella sp. TWP1-2-1b2 TaxID=2804675 RepID=UPI003CE7F4BC
MPIYSVTMDRGLVRRDSMDRHMAADAADGRNLRAQRGDVVYNMMRMWQGAVGLAHEECMVSPAYVVLSPKKQTSSGFFDQWFNARRMLYLLGAYSHGITSDRLRLYADDFARIPLHLPTLDEQQRIAAFLSEVDGKLAALAAKQAALGQFKSGLMQKLFSQEFRFTKDGGQAFPDWQEKRLGNVATFQKGKGIAKGDIAPYGATPCIRYGEIYTHYSETIRTILSRTNVPTRELTLSQSNDVIIPASGEDPLAMARACCVLQEGVALGGDINVLRSQVDGVFLAYYLTHAKRIEIAKIAQGNSVVHLYSAQLKQLAISVPHPDEQLKIAKALSAMDAKIQAVTDQATKLQTFKKGLLQQMFV